MVWTVFTLAEASVGVHQHHQHQHIASIPQFPGINSRRKVCNVDVCVGWCLTQSHPALQCLGFYGMLESASKIFKVFWSKLSCWGFEQLCFRISLKHASQDEKTKNELVSMFIIFYNFLYLSCVDFCNNPISPPWLSRPSKSLRSWKKFGSDLTFGGSTRNTLPKFNIAPEKLPSQSESSLPTIIFQGLC